jgi:hypothetical protein
MPKQHDNLFGRIANFSALKAAAKRAILGKRKKPGAAAFCANLEPELLRLESTLLDGSYRPGRYVTIKIEEPKERVVSAAPFRDRVVHHALCAVVSPIFEAGFIANSYANRTGKGTHRAIATYEGYRKRHAHVALGSIRKKSVILPTTQAAQFLGFILLPDGSRRLPDDNVARFCNRLRGLRDRWRAGSVERGAVEARVRAWIAHAEHANTWRLREAIFHGKWFDLRRCSVGRKVSYS